MTMKVCSFVEKVGVTNPQFNKTDNTVTDDVVQLGNNGSKFFFAFDDSNVTVEADAQSEFKVYDFGQAADVAEIKSNIVNMRYVTQQCVAFEDKFMLNRNTYSVIKAIKDNDTAFAAAMDACEDEKDAFLQGLGFPGVSILS